MFLLKISKIRELNFKFQEIKVKKKSKRKN